MPDPVENQKVSAVPSVGPAIEYSAGGSAPAAPLWEAAPGRCVALAVAWAVAVLALFLPGCDMSLSANRTDVRPTSNTYLLACQYTALAGQSLVDQARGRKSELDREDVPLAIACPMFVLSSVAFLLTPALLRRRLRQGLRSIDWLAVALLPTPWGLLAAAAAGDNAKHFLYGFYLLAAAHTAAFVIVAWPVPPVARSRA